MKKQKKKKHIHTYWSNSISHLMCFTPRCSGIGLNKNNQYSIKECLKDDMLSMWRVMFVGFYVKGLLAHFHFMLLFFVCVVERNSKKKKKYSERCFNTRVTFLCSITRVLFSSFSFISSSVLWIFNVWQALRGAKCAVDINGEHSRWFKCFNSTKGSFFVYHQWRATRWWFNLCLLFYWLVVIEDYINNLSKDYIKRKEKKFTPAIRDSSITYTFPQNVARISGNFHFSFDRIPSRQER